MINLGAAVSDAVQELRKTEQWRPFLEALEVQVTAKIQDSLNTPLEGVAAANFYARAINDVYVALVAMTYEVNPRQVTKPGATKLPAGALANV